MDYQLVPSKQRSRIVSYGLSVPQTQWGKEKKRSSIYTSPPLSKYDRNRPVVTSLRVLHCLLVKFVHCTRMQRSEWTYNCGCYTPTMLSYHNFATCGERIHRTGSSMGWVAQVQNLNVERAAWGMRAIYETGHASLPLGSSAACRYWNENADKIPKYWRTLTNKSDKSALFL